MWPIFLIFFIEDEYDEDDNNDEDEGTYTFPDTQLLNICNDFAVLHAFI